MSETRLILLGDYSNDQKGFEEAFKDEAVHVVEIDEQSYSALYNVQKSIEATCACTGEAVTIGLVRDHRYIPLTVVEDTSRHPNIEYQSLDEAFDLGLKNQLHVLRAALDESLAALENALPNGAEQRSIDRCLDIIHEQRKAV